jgi:type I restriction-modification system DNA methylase subunit
LSSRITERTLYPFIERVFSKLGWKCFSETGVGAQFPDLILEGNGSKVISEVKIDSEVQLVEAIMDADSKARKLGTRNSVALMFPNYVRDMPLSELERNYARLKVSALVLTDWSTDRKQVALEDLAESFTVSWKDWLQSKKVRVSYDLVVDVARDSIREVAGYLRQTLTQKPVFDSAMAVVGRFDVYKSLLEDSGVKENDARLYVADITSYIFVNQLLFYQIISEKLGYDRLPYVDPINPEKDFLNDLDITLKKAREVYPHILGFDLIPVFRGDYRIVRSIARITSALRALRPQYIQEDLFGRLYHETIPPETRKNLGAFYTKPEAAKLLATLAIDKWNATVLDPACGSGTLLVEAYQRKAQLAKFLSRDEMHKHFIEDIYGIDVMHFASHMTSMNLTAQDIEMRLIPHVVSQDGIKTMVHSLNKVNEANCPKKIDKGPRKTVNQTIGNWLQTMRVKEIPSNFDVVIMNPPFTRRERIPSKKEDLEALVPEVSGKTGYWAYFVTAADKVLNDNGVLAVVIPEEFFVGSGARCVREFLVKRYGLQFVVRTGVEIAFSESALYRDYLIILRKKPLSNYLTVIILKKRLDELREKINEITDKVLKFVSSLDTRVSNEDFDAIKFSDPEGIVNTHIGNLKPLVGFNSVEAQVLALELLHDVKDLPTFKELRERNLAKLKLYRPGQYKIKGTEKFAEKLFTSRYGSKSPNVTFLIEDTKNRRVRLRIKSKMHTFFDVPIESTIPSLRTYSGVRHLDLTNEEERGLVDPKKIPEHILNLTGLIPREESLRAALDMMKAYEDMSGNVLIARRIQLTSPGAYWLAFYSDNKILGSQLPCIRMQSKTQGKLLALYANSTIALLQLLSFVAESRGSWVSLDHERVWSNLHFPRIDKVSKRIVAKASSLFDKLGKVDVTPLQQRIKIHDPLQKSIDELALEMLGINNWKGRLDEIYDAITKELQTMHKILETSHGKPKKAKAQGEKAKEATRDLKDWLEPKKIEKG